MLFSKRWFPSGKQVSRDRFPILKALTYKIYNIVAYSSKKKIQVISRAIIKSFIFFENRCNFAGIEVSKELKADGLFLI